MTDSPFPLPLSPPPLVKLGGEFSDGLSESEEDSCSSSTFTAFSSPSSCCCCPPPIRLALDLEAKDATLDLWGILSGIRLLETTPPPSLLPSSDSDDWPLTESKTRPIIRPNKTNDGRILSRCSNEEGRRNRLRKRENNKNTTLDRLSAEILISFGLSYSRSNLRRSTVELFHIAVLHSVGSSSLTTGYIFKGRSSPLHDGDDELRNRDGPSQLREANTRSVGFLTGTELERRLTLTRRRFPSSSASSTLTRSFARPVDGYAVPRRRRRGLKNHPPSSLWSTR